MTQKERYSPNTLLQQLRKRLQSRVFLHRHLEADIAPNAFHLLGFVVNDNGQLGLQYAASEADLKKVEHLPYLVKQRFDFAETISREQLDRWLTVGENDEPPIETLDAQEFLNKVLEFGGTGVPVPGQLYVTSPRSPKEIRWVAEIVSLIALHASVEEAIHQSPKIVDKPATKSLCEIRWLLAPVVTFGIPIAFLLIDGSIDSSTGKKPLAHYLVDLASTELEEMRWEDILDDTIRNMVAGMRAEHALKRAVEENFAFPPPRLWPTHWQKCNVQLYKDCELSFPQLNGKLSPVIEDGIKRLRARIETLLDRLGDAEASLAKGFRAQSVAAIAAQSLSHNIGSHALSDARLFDPSKAEDGDGLKDFHQYLQGRMDYVAQLIARTPPQPEPLYLWGDLLGDFFRQRLLLNRLVADRSVEGQNLSFLVELPLATEPTGHNVIKCENRDEAVRMITAWLDDRKLALSNSQSDMDESAIQQRIAPFRRHCIYPTGDKARWWQILGVCWKDIELALGVIAMKDTRNGHGGGAGKVKTGVPMAGPLEDMLVAIPGGSVGRHALYSILENLTRNSVKYGERRESSNNLCIHLRVRDPDKKNGKKNESEDYWLLEIWDNFSGFPKESEPERYSKLADSFRQDVIDNEGKARTSGHGLIEIKEAMRFLHDHKNNPESDETENPSPWACRPHCHRTSPAHGATICDKQCQHGNAECCHANLANVFDPAYDGLPDKVGTLVYRVRLRRPRLLGVWVQGVEFDEANCSSVAKGVFFRNGLIRKELTEAQDGVQPLTELCPHLLVLRDPGEGEGQIEQMVKALAKEHWRLPFRLFVVTSSEQSSVLWKRAINIYEGKVPTEPAPNYSEPFLPHNRVRVIDAPDLHQKLGNPDELELNLALVNEVYDHWLMAFKPLPDGAAFSDSDKWHLAVCFDRDKQTVEKLWSAANGASVKALRSVSITAYSQTEVAAGRLDWQGSQVNIRRLIHFGNHGCQPPGENVADAINDTSVAFSQAFGSNEAPRTFNLLYSPPSDPEGFSFFALSVAEAALTRIAIFDERASAMFLSDGGNKVFSGLRLLEATLARLHPLIAVNAFDAPDGAFAIDNVEWKLMKKTVEPQPPTYEFLYPYPESGVQMRALHDADILILHEGLIEELVSKKKFKQGSELCYFSGFAQIVRTSGKGRDPRKLDTRLPFCEYSAISAALAPYKSGKDERVRFEKIILAKAVINSFGQLSSKEKPS